ncbi:YodC family protein [Citrobacter braakii]|uniref:YodC family protein n=1 Tax=Citrobacter braakii TaxID=57706 RepID=UPI0031F147CF
MSNNSGGLRFKVGDIVYLVSGGPSMSVAEQVRDFKAERGWYYTGHYKCQWFSGKKLDHGVFPEESLTSTPPKP